MNAVTLIPVNEYKKHVETLIELIQSGPFKINYLCDYLDVSRVTFYKKKKTGTFSLDEVEKLTL